MEKFIDRLPSDFQNNPLQFALIVTTLAIGASYLAVNVILPVAMVALSIMMSMAPYALAFYLGAHCAGFELFPNETQQTTCNP